MKNYSIILLCLLLLFSCKKKESKEEVKDDFEVTVLEVIKAFKEKDAATLNQFVDKDKGVIIVHNPGAIAIYERTDMIDFDNPVPEYYPYETDLPDDYQLRYEMLPDYSCDTESWDKTGLFCDTLAVANQLSSLAEFLKEFNPGDEGKDWDTEIEEIKTMEKDSRRVILSSNDKEYLTFQLTLKDGKWYLTLLDRILFCSA